MRLWRAAAPALVVLALGLGGCSTSYKLGGLFGSEAGAQAGEPTASIAPARGRGLMEPAAEADLVLAKAAAVEVMRRGSADASQPWENPRTGARGTVTPIASAYRQEGATCRDFLASYLRGSQESWYQGGACRRGSTWEVREIRPLQRT